jgi:smad nuclear-interacting protein 1
VDACAPDKHWRLYPFKVNGAADQDLSGRVIHLHKSSYFLIGKDRKIATIPLLHPSISKQHAVIQFRNKLSKDRSELIVSPYIIDLESTNGTQLNGRKLEPAKYYKLVPQDRLRFAFSSKEYVLLHAQMV